MSETITAGIANAVPAFSVYLFDVDGTLVDSAPDICGAIQSVLAAAGRTDVEDAFLRRYIGLHLLDTFQDVFPHYTPEQIEALIADYRRVYPSREHACTRRFDGVAEVLAALPGRKSTATTKGTPTTRIVLERFGLLSFFDRVQGTDGFPAKPAPDVIFKSIEAFGATPDDCLFVGDSPADMEAGKRAGVKTCAVLWGYGEREQLLRWEPDYVIDRPEQLCSTASAR